MTHRWILFLLLMPSVTLSMAQERIEFSGHTWVVHADEIKIEPHQGREALRLRNAALTLVGPDFESGTIEFDLSATGERCFAGVAFRRKSEENYEHFYLRPHQTGRFDAMQYTPVFHGISAWQLYPEFNAALDIPKESWLHVKLRISGSRLDVFADGKPEAVLSVSTLKHGKGRGSVALTSFFPSANADDSYPVSISNFVIHPEKSPGDYARESAPPSGSGLIDGWALSPSFAATKGDLRKLPPEVLQDEDWLITTSEPSGLLNLARYRGFPANEKGGTVLARIYLDSEKDQAKKLNFGFSDRGSIFLNGELLFTGINTYRSRSLRYLGVLTVDNDAVYLPLIKGRNELVIAVSEAFGGWGLIGKLENLEGLAVRPGTR